MGVTMWDYADRGNRAKGVTIGRLELYFSYQTVIAFRDGKEKMMLYKFTRKELRA